MKNVFACLALSAALTLGGGCAPSDNDGDGGGDGGDGGDGGGGGGGGGGGCNGPSCYNECPAGQQTTLSGVVTAPNGIDPVPGAVVYVPQGGVNEFPPEVRCEVCDQLSDTALVSTVTNTDGTFTLGPIPTVANQQPGRDVQIVTQMGRFRKASMVTIDNPCSTNTGNDPDFQLPGRHIDDLNTIPNIAVATGDYDVMECVLLKIGLEQGEFDLYQGLLLPDGTPTAGNFDALLGDLDRMKQYNIIFINCANDTYESMLGDATIRQNIENYVLSGGRLYVTDWSYDYVEQIPEFSPLIDFEPGMSTAAPEPMNAAALGPGDIEVDAQVLDQSMAEWLRAVEARTGDEIISDANTVHIGHFLGNWVQQFAVPSSEHVTTWLDGNAGGQRPLTTTFDYNQCGRVLYSSYHTAGRAPGFGGFPNYCESGALSPQERVLEYLIFHIADCIAIE